MTATTVTPERMFRVREVADTFDCDEGTIYRLIREERLRAIRVGRLLRVPESALTDFIAGAH